MQASQQEVHARVARWRARSRTQRYPQELKEQVVEYARRRLEEGATTYRISAEVGVPQPTVERWLEVLAAPGALVPVRIKPDEPSRALPAALDSAPVIVTSRGWRVEGLRVADIAALLQVAS